MNVKTKDLKECGKATTPKREGMTPRLFQQRVRKRLKEKGMIFALWQGCARRVRELLKIQGSLLCCLVQ